MLPSVEPAFATLPEILALAIFREARGELPPTRTAVGCSIRNRTLKASWWNSEKAGDYGAVILKPWQYSSFNTNDPNATKYPTESDAADWQAWQGCLMSAKAVIGGCIDLSQGADSYIDRSIMGTPHQPTWAIPAHLTVQLGRLYFYKTI